MSARPDSGSVDAQTSKVKGSGHSVKCPPGHARIGWEKVRDGEVIERGVSVIPINKLEPIDPSRPIELP